MPFQFRLTATLRFTYVFRFTLRFTFVFRFTFRLTFVFRFTLPLRLAVRFLALALRLPPRFAVALWVDRRLLLLALACCRLELRDLLALW